MSNIRPKVCFIGNCQAQALTSLSLFLNVNVDVAFLPPVFDISTFSDRSVRDEIYKCDFVFNQAVSEDFPIEYIRPSAIKSAFADRAHSWPNIYFDGYFPGIRYIYAGSGREKLTGPLSEYHFSVIYTCWHEGASAAECANMIESACEPYFSDKPVEQSLYNLRQREANLDVGIVDYISNYYRIHKLFFSMNHPSDLLLHEMLSRCCSRIGVEVPSAEATSGYPYSLNKIQIPSLPVFMSRYRPYFRENLEFRGVALDMTNIYAGEGTESMTYSLRELIAAFYRLYDWHKSSTFMEIEYS